MDTVTHNNESQTVLQIEKYLIVTSGVHHLPFIASKFNPLALEHRTLPQIVVRFYFQGEFSDYCHTQSSNTNFLQIKCIYPQHLCFGNSIAFHMTYIYLIMIQG
jgi:hypothetical protein